MSEMLPPGKEPLNVYRAKLQSILIPKSLGPVPDSVLTWFDKYLYGHLRFRIADGEYKDFKLKQLAEDLNVNEVSIARSFARLADAGLIYRKRLQHDSRIFLLNCPLLAGSISKTTPPEYAPKSTLKTGSESTPESSLKNPESTPLQVQTRLRSNPESTPESSAYKESGFSSGFNQDCSSSSDTASVELPAAAAAPLDEESKTPEELLADGRIAIAIAANSAVCEEILQPDDTLIAKIYEVAISKGCRRVRDLISFMATKRRRRFRGQIAWLSVVADFKPDWQVSRLRSKWEKLSAPDTPIDEVPFVDPAEAWPGQWSGIPHPGLIGKDSYPSEPTTPKLTGQGQPCPNCRGRWLIERNEGRLDVYVELCSCNGALDMLTRNGGDAWLEQETQRRRDIEADLQRSYQEFERKYPGRVDSGPKEAICRH